MSKKIRPSNKVRTERLGKQLRQNVRVPVWIFAIVFPLLVLTSYLSARSILRHPKNFDEIVAAEDEVYNLAAKNNFCSDGQMANDSQQKDLKASVRVNSHANRAIVSFCNDVGQLLAKNSDGVWKPVLSLDARPGLGKQDYRVLAACDIADIASGYHETRPEFIYVAVTAPVRTCRDL